MDTIASIAGLYCMQPYELAALADMPNVNEMAELDEETVEFLIDLIEGTTDGVYKGEW